MTVVLAMVGTDGIVISADGRATFTDGQPSQDNYRKIYRLDDVVVGFAAAQLPQGYDTRFLAGCQAFIRQQGVRFNVAEYTAAMASLARINFPNDDGFEIGFIVAGYDRDEHNNPTTPHVYRFLSRNDYVVEDCPSDKQVISLIGQPTALDKLPTVRDTESLKHYFTQMIRKNEGEMVGGNIRTVIMKGDDVQETVQTPN